MNKLTKASIATAAGVVLLLGGGGTLAYWNASTDAGAATITAGNLQITEPTPGAWTWARGTAPQTTGTIADINNFRAVPGDKLILTQEVVVVSSGNNLKFQAAVTPGSITAAAPVVAANTALAAELNATAVVSSVALKAGTQNVTFDAGTQTATVTGSGTATLVVTLEINWPFGAPTTGLNNGSKTGVVSFANTSVTLTQVQ